MNDIQKYFILIFSILFVVAALFSIWDSFFPESDVVIDAEYFSGMLGAISIVFGFSSWVVTKAEKYGGLVVTVFFVGPLMMLMAGIGKITEVAQEKGNPEATLYWLSMTLAVTILGLLYLLVYKNVKSLDEDKTKLEDL